MHQSGEHDAEHQPGDDDAQQRVQPQHPPQASVLERVERQADRDHQYQQVALDREVTEQSPEPHAQPHGLLAGRRVDVGAVDQQVHLTAERGRDSHRKHDVSRPADIAPACNGPLAPHILDIRHALMIPRTMITETAQVRRVRRSR